MTPGFSMRGSGIYSYTVTREIVCRERCEDCMDSGFTCMAVFDSDFETDDWGNVDAEVKCDACGHMITFREESD